MTRKGEEVSEVTRRKLSESNRVAWERRRVVAEGIRRDAWLDPESGCAYIFSEGEWSAYIIKPNEHVSATPAQQEGE